jgi:hypothetical protein
VRGADSIEERLVAQEASLERAAAQGELADVAASTREEKRNYNVSLSGSAVDQHLH